MRRVTLVRRKDGETVPFDETRVVEAVERALSAAGSRDGFPEPTLFDSRAVIVDDTAAGTSAPYSREALARTLAVDGLLSRAAAD